MITIGNMLKVVTVIIVSYFVGWVIGAFLGAVFGVVISLLVQDIVSSNQAALISIFVSLTLGSLISLFALQVSNALFETNINRLIGVIPGVLVGLVIVVFVSGYVDVTDPQYNGYRAGTRFAVTPIMYYSSMVGRQIAATIFPFLGAFGTIREIIKSHQELQRNRELMKNLPASHWGLPEIPLKTLRPILVNSKTSSLPSVQEPIKSARAGILLFSIKTFGIACVIGVILSILGWQVFGWKSSTQFSEGFFWTSAVLAIYGYLSMLGEHKMRQIPTVRYSETEGDVSLSELNRQWAVDAAKAFTSFPNTFLTSAYLFGFSILISIIF